MLMLAGINGVLITGDLFNLYVFLEVAAIAGYFLVAFGTEGEELEAGFKYLIMSAAGSALILLGIAFIYGLTGSIDFGTVATS
jgi:multicomponent Na+:H+ antiporter subunit D